MDEERWSKKSIIKILVLLVIISLCLVAIGFIFLHQKKIEYSDTQYSMIYRETANLKDTNIREKNVFYNYTGAKVKAPTEEAPEAEELDVINETPERTSLVIKIEELQPTINDCYSNLSKELNLSLLKTCRNYFTLDGVTALMPMIIANNETAIRADKNLTFCSLYPSAVFHPTSADDLYEISTLTPLESAYNFSNLANDWWTRDRGPLQMNPSYGIHADKWNTMLGSSEKEKLDGISKSFTYTVYTYKEDMISANYWIENAGTTAGDRFDIKDCCLRLASEYNHAFSIMSSAYKPDTQEKKIAMLSMYHGAGSMWLSNFEDKKIGYWNSGKAAYKYVEALTSDEALKLLYDYTLSVLREARKNNTNPEIGITTREALELLRTFKEKGILEDKSAYISAGDYSDGYYTYPLKALYNYMQLSLLYNGG